MADGKLVFPIKFDLASAVKEASGDIDKTLRRMETMIQHRPLQMRIKIDEGAAGGTSIKAIQKRMGELVNEWEKMSNKVKYTDDTLKEYSATAKRIIHEFATLTGATRTHAQTLSELQRASDKAVTAEEKKMAAQQKAVAKSQQMVSMLNAEETTLTAVAAKMKFYQEIANRKDYRTSEYKYAAEQLQRLGAQYERLKAIMNSNTGNGGKDTFGAERMKVTLRGAEHSIKSVKAKLRVLDQILSKTPQDSFGFRRASEEATRLMGVLKQLEANTPKSIAKEQENLQKALIDEAAKRAEIYNKKRQQEAEDLAAQQRKAAEEARIKAESQAKAQQENEARKRILNEQRLSYDTLIQKIQMLEAARNKTDIGAARWQRLTNEINKAKESLKVITDEMDRAARRSERLARLREIMSMSQQSMAGLTARMQEYNALLQKMDAGSTGFNRLALYIARLSEEYQRVNQYAQDFQQKSMQGVASGLVDESVRRLQDLRSELKTIDGEINARTQAIATGRGSAMTKDLYNDLLDRRLAKQKEINEITKTAEQQAIERERQITAEMEKQKRKAEELAKKQQARTSQKNLLKSQSKDIDTLTKKLQYYQNLLNRLDFNTKPGQFTAIAKEVEKLTKDLDEARKKMAELTGQSTSGSSTQARNARKVSHEYSTQLGYVDRLIRRMMVYGSVGMIGNFLRQVREVTAQFELQKVSLGAILQDQNKANQLFSEIKSFALKSPVSILDLTKYTKQLAAYKIGYDELFETTKKLTDVSVGLGVSMDRVVLAYGQVRATGHLRASEIRQFTEMGVPIVEELAAKLSKMNGELVTAADVMDMVSKRGISFQMVKDVFDDMTSAGGIFYNMQEKQGNTLYGLWAKLGDAASVMYSEIGDTGFVNSAMKTLISSMTWLMKNWRLMNGEIVVLGSGLGAYKIVQALVTKNTVAAARATDDYTRARLRHRVATMKNNVAQALSAKYVMKAALANRQAARSTNLWTAAKLRLTGAVNNLKAALIGNWLTLVITAMASLGVIIAAAYEKSTRLKRALKEIKNETSTLQGQSVRNFEHLADAAVKAADGSKKQKDALDELNRTYKDILPEEALKIGNLRAMKGNYESLTQAIRENIAAQQESKALEEIKNEYSPKIIKAKGEAEKALSKAGFGDTEIQRFFRNIERHYKELSDRWRKGEEIDVMGEIFNMSGIDANKLSDKQLMKVAVAYTNLVNAQEAWIRKEEEVRKSYEGSTAYFGAYTKSMQNYNDWVQKNLNSGETILQNQQNVNMQVKGMENMIRQVLQQVGIAWKEEWANIEKSVDPDNLNKITTLNIEAIVSAVDPNKYPDLWKFIDAIRKKYNDLVPPDLVAQDCRRKFFEIAQSMKDGGDTMRQHLWDGKVALKDHVETLGDAVDRIREKVFEYSQFIKYLGQAGKLALKAKGIDVDTMTAQANAIEKLMNYEKTYLKPEEKKNKGRKSDTRLQELQEINQTLEKINKEYDDLQKKEGKTKALEDIKKQFADTIAYTNKTGKKFGLHFDYPTEFKTLQEYRREILNVMKSLKNLKGGEKAILSFETLIGKADSDELQKQIEKELKAIAEKISRAKVADDFYRKILSATGDYKMAGQIAKSIFGQDGRKLQSVVAEQVRNMTNGLQLPEGIISPDNIINYKKLREWAEANKDELGGMYDQLVKISETGQKDLAKSYEGYLKDLEKAKTYADKRVELARTTAEKIREINMQVAAGSMSKEDGEEKKRGYMEREQRKEAELDWEAFKDMPIYTQMFEDLEHASTFTLTMMKNHLTGLKGLWGSALAPTQIKEIQSRIEDVEKQLETHNPWKTLKTSWDNYKDALGTYDPNKAVENVGKASGNLLEAQTMYGKDSAQAKLAEQELGVQRKMLEISRLLTDDKGKRLKGTKALDAANQKAYRNQLIAQQELKDATDEEQDARTRYGEDSAQYEAAHAVVLEKKEELEIAEKVSKITQKNANTATKWKDSMTTAADEIVRYMTMASDAARSIANLTEAFGGSKEDVQFWNDIAGGLENITSGFGDLIKNILSLNISGIISSAITAIPKMITGFMDIFSAGRIRKANKEIKRQQEILDGLEYTYGRLQDAADKLFGRDYIRNYNQQLWALQAEQQAYLKQAEAEKSKGKKEDKEKTQEYLDNARDAADEIAELQGQLAEHFTGSSRGDIARQMAQSWIEARISMSDTFAAIKSDYIDMIKNMIVEGAAARVIENALSPMWKRMDDMLADNNINGAIDALVNGMDSALNAANNGMEVLWQALEAKGYDMKQLLNEDDSDYTGIAKNVSTATSEEINANTAALNTQNYYLSHVPGMAENVAAMRTLLENQRASIEAGVAVADYTSLMEVANRHLESLPRIEQHTANIQALLNRVIVTKGGKSGIVSFYNS